ncbi:hypothetical protein MKEN_00996200 [Mycena kentingensis (nom. inval.)]|nr:hypothetical protein MKEN_00996200 [Mycena kentingensis (nom. inval.)]
MMFVYQVPPRFGLLDASEDRWPKFLASLAHLNETATDGSMYKLFFLGRHGQGYHNLAANKYGKTLWDAHWTKLQGDGEIIWGPDPELTPLGEEQARYAHAVWKTELAAGAPLPQRAYCSPLTRALETHQIIYSGLGFLVSTPLVMEDLRECYGEHTCDKRRTRSEIARAFPEILIEDGFTEEDELWTEKREQEHSWRRRAESFMERVFREARDAQVIAITAHRGTVHGLVHVAGREDYAYGLSFGDDDHCLPMPGPAAQYGPDEYEPGEAPEYVHYTFITNYINYSIASLLLYELVTSLDDEVSRVWSLKWRLPKILFMLNRYVIRAMLIALWIVADFPGTSPEFCRIYGYWQMIPLRLAILAAQALVVIRVWAIYNNSRPMLYVLSALYGAEFIAVAVSVIAATIDTQGVAQLAPLSCGLVSRSGYLLKEYASGTWIAPVCFEFIMVIITLIKLLPRWSFANRHNSHLPGSGSGIALFGFGLGSGGNQTLDVLARDSLVYFLFIFSFTLANAVIYMLSFNAHYHSLLLGPTSAISCIAVSRMMINIRALPAPGSQAADANGTTTHPLSISLTQLHTQPDYTRPSQEQYPVSKGKHPKPHRSTPTPDLEAGVAFSDVYGGHGLGLGNLPPDLSPVEDDDIPGSARPFLSPGPGSTSGSRAGSREDLRPPRPSRDIAYPPAQRRRQPRPSTAGSVSTLVGSGSGFGASPPGSAFPGSSPLSTATLSVSASPGSSSLGHDTLLCSSIPVLVHPPLSSQRPHTAPPSMGARGGTRHATRDENDQPG